LELRFRDLPQRRKPALDKGGELATRVTKSGAGVDAGRGKAEEREQSGRWCRQIRRRREAVEVEGETAMDL
jgi:hypothetical protein